MENRRIGNYINPIDGEQDWFEPATANKIILQPRMATKVDDTYETAIDFELSNDDDKKLILLRAKYTDNNKDYYSKWITMEELEFADQITEKIYADDESIDNAKIIKEAKEQAIISLTKNLMDAGILLGGMSFEGFGFIKVDDDKVLTIEGIDFTYSIENSKGIKSLTLKNCVGQASLQNLENPKIIFLTGEYELFADNLEITSSNDGTLKTYVVKVKNFRVNNNITTFDHMVYDKYDFANDEFLDGFIKSRRSLLDDSLGKKEQDSFDELLEL